MQKENLNIKLKILVVIMFILIGFAFCHPINAEAQSVTLSPSNFGFYSLDDHNGMSIHVDGTGYFFCVQRGYPFRSVVADTHACMGAVDNWDWETGETWSSSEPMASAIRSLLVTADSGGEAFPRYFRGWGTNWAMNDDCTNAVLTGSNLDSVPSSGNITEVFDREALGNYLSLEDKENEEYSKLYLTEFNVLDSITQEGPYDLSTITGHEGAKLPHPVVLKKKTYSEIGLSASQVNALALIGYYIWQDPDASGFSTTAKLQTSAALCWAVESGFVTANGSEGRSIKVIFKDSVGKTKYTYGMSCDNYVKIYIGNQYEAMKLYRQFVWKMNNLRTIPSFAYDGKADAIYNPIHLQWDADENAYVATVADANGVLKYFDFNMPGLTVSENDDGTLYIRSENTLNGTLTSEPSKSRLLPDDCTFHLPTAWRWDLEGTSKTFTYTSLVNDVLHAHDLGCRWQCQIEKTEFTNCTRAYNKVGHESIWMCGKSEHEHDDSCYDEDDDLTCNEDEHTHNSSCHNCNFDTCHEHNYECTHAYVCPATETVTVHVRGDIYSTYENTTDLRTGIPETCSISFSPCHKKHYSMRQETLEAKYMDWQDLINFSYSEGNTLVDPVNAYISVVTDVEAFDSETDVDIKLIDQWGNEADHIKVGEPYKVRYIYSYSGSSKGFKINDSYPEKTYYYFYYISRMQSPNSTISLYNLRGSANQIVSGAVPHSVLDIDLTPITIRGLYTTAETPYTLNGTYTFDSGDAWNDNIYLDALTTDQWDDGYRNLSEGEIAGSSTNANPQKKSVTVAKANDKLTVTWVYETEYEVFTSGMIQATAYVQVGGNNNYASSYFDEKYSYGKFEDHNNAGGQGYFTSDQSGNLIDRHSIATQNSEYPSYAVKNKVWQSDIDIKVSNFITNTGAGITEHNYSERENATHPLNYNLYYTINVENPKATIFENKVRSYNGHYEDNSNTQEINTNSDVYEFDINTSISWGASGSTINTIGAEGNVIVTDHIKTGTTYIQREIPVVLNTLFTNKAVMNMKIYPNHDRLVYEDYYSGVTMSGDAINRKVIFTIKDSYYPSNEQSATSDIFAAINPNNKYMQPQNIAGSNNVPNTNDSENRTYPGNQITTFNIMLSNGETKTVFDSHTKNYNQYNFTFNRDYRNNRVSFASPRKSTIFFKYSNTDYYYNGEVQSATGDFVADNTSQTESYYISQVLFKSNYTSKYKKELEAKGANYIEDRDANGNLLDGWIDMVNQNKFAIVSAGQGFELRVTVKYENSRLTQYLARYFGFDDAQNALVGSSNNLGPQYCNISSMTGWANDGKTHAYINGFNTLDRLAVNLITGSNVYNDLFCFMSDNPDTVYSYSGIYGTPVIFDREISYSADYSVTTITYTMCVSQENGIPSNTHNMKFFTNQLAPDKKSPGIVEGFYDVKSKGEHSITLWTPVFAATPFDYPNAIQDRYIGDAIELGYTIKTTSADDSIVHIVQ